MADKKKSKKRPSKATKKKVGTKRSAGGKKPEDLTTDELTDKALAEVEDKEAAAEAKAEAEESAGPGVPEKQYVTVRGKSGCKKMLLEDYQAMRAAEAEEASDDE